MLGLSPLSGSPVSALSESGISASAALAGVGTVASTVVVIGISSPVSDIATNGWLRHDGASTNLYQAIDEAFAADDGDYIISPVAPTGSDFYETSLVSLTDASVDDFTTVTYRIGSDFGTVTNVVVTLREGTTVRKTWTHTNVSALTTYSQALSPAEIASIVNWADLRLRISG